ncbi:Hint domain-containing protein [Antarctobacter jejuensis]|uniref:Hint domain-containing protein n=1 Tax=Antarctobacter jejuensis TaxID=1439938 RepID=UPI003FCF0F29
MPFSIFAVDSSFAVSTGSNVRSTSTTSRFDYPPNSTKDLIITTKAGDTDPRLFELGDVYEVSFGGNGASTITDAVVIRSDAPLTYESDGTTPSGNEGVIVFEGLDENGDLTQVVWTPNFDLENWYWTNYTPSDNPEFYTADMDSDYTHAYICFERTVKLATPVGYVRADKVEVGQTLCTWGGVKREVRWIGRKTVDGTGAMAPVRFAKGAIGNFAPIKLSPQHRVLVSAPGVEQQFGAPDVLVPAISLVDGKQVRQVSREKVQYVHILLDQHDILIAEGAPCESLHPGPRTRELLSPEDRAAIDLAMQDKVTAPCRPLLRSRDGKSLAPRRHVPERGRARL